MRDIDVIASSPVELTIKMSVKCPHCKALNKVAVRTEIEIVRTIQVNGRTLSEGNKKEERDTIRTLSD